jgi:NADPH:quinone reductase-like Zn-dependent oxidoreductase
VIATSSTPSKLQIAHHLGAISLINYTTTRDWATEVRRLTGDKGADLVCDVGGAGTLEQSIASLKQGGTACVVGMLTVPGKVDVVLPLLVGAKICMFPSGFCGGRMGCR